MRIIIDNKGDQYIDKPLFDYMNNIWLNYDTKVSNGSNIFFAKNTTINKIITHYIDQDIHRVIKKDKATHVIISKISLSDYPQYYDSLTNCIVQDDTKEPIFGIYNLKSEDKLTIEQIQDFVNSGQNITYVNQDYLNSSLNNGFIIDNNNYTTFKELIDSQNEDNCKLAVDMLVNSDIKSNWEWILYLFHKNKNYLSEYDPKHIIINMMNTINRNLNTIAFNNIDVALKLTKNKPEVHTKFIDKIKCEFNNKISIYFEELGTKDFILEDFKIRYNG